MPPLIIIRRGGDEVRDVPRTDDGFPDPTAAGTWETRRIRASDRVDGMTLGYRQICETHIEVECGTNPNCHTGNFRLVVETDKRTGETTGPFQMFCEIGHPQVPVSQFVIAQMNEAIAKKLGMDVQEEGLPEGMAHSVGAEGEVPPYGPQDFIMHKDHFIPILDYRPVFLHPKWLGCEMCRTRNFRLLADAGDRKQLRGTGTFYMFCEKGHDYTNGPVQMEVVQPNELLAMRTGIYVPGGLGGEALE